MLRALMIVLLSVLAAGHSLAHDSWVQTNTNVVRTGDAVHLDLMLGNHGNEHRDFKLAGKVGLEGCTLAVTGPDGTTLDVSDRLKDVGYAPNEGFWSAKYIAVKSGLYTVGHTLQSQHRSTRTIKSGKAYFVASLKLDDVPVGLPGFDKPLGHPLELVPVTNPVMPMGPEVPISVKLLFKGKPLAGAVVSFIPRGETLKEGFDERYERKTDAEGKATFTPKTGNWYLVAAHRIEADEKGDGFDKTTYSATLNVFVPEYCTCCE